MRIIDTSELRNNMDLYFDLATTETILIQRGQNETFVLTKDNYLAPDADLNRAVSFDEFKRQALQHVKSLYNHKKPCE